MPSILRRQAAGRIGEQIEEVQKNTKVAGTSIGEVTEVIDSVASSNLATAADLSMISEELRDSASAYRTGTCKFDITSVKMAHIEWNRRLSDVISGRANMRNEDVASSSHCEFGKWIASLQDAELQANPWFVKVVDLHDRVHAKAREVVVSVNAKNHADADRRFKEFQEVRTQMFHALNQAYIVAGPRV